MLFQALQQPSGDLPNTVTVEELERIIAEAEEIFKAYENGLPIRVSLISTYVNGEPNGWWGGLQREWWPLRGIVVQRSYKSKRIPPPPDTESFSLEAIVSAQRPDVDYIGVVDFIRRWVLFWNKWLSWIIEFPVPDFWGTAVLKSKEGRETVLLEHMVNPLAGFDYIVECTQTMLRGLKAYERLKKMTAEKKAAPSVAQKVEAEARFRLAVEKRLEDLRAEESAKGGQ